MDTINHPIRYNPKRAGLEWSDITMEREADSGAGELITFASPRMILAIPQPGELYREESLGGEVKVTVNRLLSGLDARLFDATGTLLGQPRVARQTRSTPSSTSDWTTPSPGVLCRRTSSCTSTR